MYNQSINHFYCCHITHNNRKSITKKSAIKNEGDREDVNRLPSH